MARTVITLEDRDVMELNMIVLDRDREAALIFLKQKIQSQISGKEKKKLNVEGKTHL